LDVQLARLKALKTADFAEFNQTLEFWKLEPIKVP
jgi:hypothetical protein